MSAFFVVTYVISILIIVLLYLILVKRLEINWQRKNKHAVSFFLPVLLTCLLIGQVSLDFRPRTLDLIELVNQNSGIAIVNADQIDKNLGLVKLDDQELYYYDLGLELEQGSFYRVVYGRRSRLVINLEKVINNNE